MKIITLKHNEQGMIALLVTLVTMLMLSITVISFAQIARREQRNALDHQLSSQAYYAAESGVNDAIRILQAAPAGDKKVCGTTAQYPLNGVINAANNVAYTCLLVSQTPDNLQYSPAVNQSINADMNFIDPVTNAATTADSIVIKWQDSSNPANTKGNVGGGGYPNLPPTSSWIASTPPPVALNTALLRMALTNLGFGFHRDEIDKNTFTAFLYPSSSGSGSVTYAPNDNTPGNWAAQGKIYETTCAANWCTATVTIPNLSHVYLRLSAIYAAAGIEITAYDGLTKLKIGGAQAVIDSTGKAQDVLRRVQVHVPIQPGNSSASTYAIQAVQGICKQLDVYSPPPAVNSCP
jgi:Tfp pilus assembly protein PilX